jgi:hypothetical protein
VVVDEERLAVALRYVSLNPVRTRLVKRAQDWRWSSTHAHRTGKDDGITARAPIRNRFPDFADLIANASGPDALARLRAAGSIGRPLGDDRFPARIERLIARRLRPGKRGPRPRPMQRKQKHCHRITVVPATTPIQSRFGGQDPPMISSPQLTASAGTMLQQGPDKMLRTSG